MPGGSALRSRKSAMESIQHKVKTPTSNRKRKHNDKKQLDHPRKRARTCTGHPEGKSYFDKLSLESAKNIIRFTSETPRSANWIAHVSPELVLSLLEANAVMASVCRKLFVSLEVSPTYNNNATSLKVEDNSRLQVERLISSLAEAVTELSVEASCGFSVSWKRCLTAECLKLRRLSLRTWRSSFNVPLSLILSSNCETLKFLEIKKKALRKTEVTAIGQFGQGLTGLKLRVMNPSNAIDTIWKSMGANLEELSFSGRLNLQPVMNNCKKLQKVFFKYLQSDGHQHLEDLCKGLGKQLTFATLDSCGVDSARLGRIASSCENVSLHVEENGGNSIAELQAMGARACFAHIGWTTMHYSDTHFLTFQVAGERCENLRSMFVSNDVTEAAFRALFVKPKPLLVDFNARSERYHNVQYIFEVLARNVSSIETLDFVGRLPPMSILEDFVESNPCLKTVRIVDYREEANCSACFKPIDLSMGVVASLFLRCKKLKKIEVSCIYCDTSTRREHFAKACSPARHRNVTVRICEYTYFQ